MFRSTLSSKGQLVIPKDIRDRHHWEMGQVIDLEDHEDYVIMRLVRPFPRKTVLDLARCLTTKSIQPVENRTRVELQQAVTESQR